MIYGETNYDPESKEYLKVNYKLLINLFLL